MLGRRSNRATAGFILPTVVMVILVVTLLTTAIVIRSTDRAKNASNYRVNQVTLNASLPAIERAKAKINQLFTDPNLPQGTPSDISLYNVLKQSEYTLGDETRLRIAFDINGNGQIQHSNDIGNVNDEIATTAWRYPVDTDNNGKYDSFTLYGAFFRSPNRTGTGFARTRTPLDSRSAPQDNSGLTGFCAAAAGTSASLVGSDGWYKSGANLKKSFYVYTATVPITNTTELGLPAAQYEALQGNKGFTALEYQQDRVKVPLGNNAVVYEDDLDLFSGTQLNINGRIITNSNLLASSFQNNGRLKLYQVSSDESCFYEEENGKILIGGNVGFGPVGVTGLSLGNVTVDLFQGAGNNPTFVTDGITNTNKSVTNTPDQLAYNNQAYEERIAFLVNAILDPDNNPATPTPYPQTLNGAYPACRPNCKITTSKDPAAIKANIEQRINDSVRDPNDVRGEELDTWFRNRTRRVPYQEVSFGTPAIPAGVTSANAIQEYGVGDGNRLRPREDWMYPTATSNGGKTGSTTTTGRTGLSMTPNQLAATDPITRNNEEKTGDRILVGNNLPALFYNTATQKFEANAGEFTDKEGQQLIDGTTKWKQSGSNTDSSEIRYRKSQVAPSVNVGMTDRDDTWEEDAAKVPDNPLDDKGGLRIITGAGVYLKGNSPVNLPTPNMSKVVWPDWMPAIPEAARPGTIPGTPPTWLPNSGTTWDTFLPDQNTPTPNARPFLRMRATAVYHYRYDNDSDRKTAPAPIACVSSYYDPTNRNTAQNRTVPALPNVSGGLANIGSRILPLASPNQYAIAATAATTAQSNNGVTYRQTITSATIPANDPQLLQQAELVYPNGRLVNPLLRQAVSKPFADRTLAENAAVDSTVCALQILGLRGGPLTPNSTTLAGASLPHGTIQEIAFLDGREVKQIESDRGTSNLAGGTTYDDTSYSFQPNDKSQNDFLRTKTITANTNKRSEYDLPIELRQPMEVRATVLDLDVLRQQTVNTIPPGTAAADLPTPEYLLPNSGIVYVSRDDALPDASNKKAIPWTALPPIAQISKKLAEHELDINRVKDRVSATDFWLDPTRRVSGVVLMNGKRLARGKPPKNIFRAEEKGLILATNLPAYIKAQPANTGTPTSTIPGFNVHDSEEFTAALATNWGNFYTRTTAQINENFACRSNDPRLAPKCPTGDQWRAAAVLSDAITLLSDNFRFGFRNEGDYDLRNNQVDNGFRNVNVALPGNTAQKPLKDEPAAPPTKPTAIPGLVVAGKDPETPNKRDDSIEEKRLVNGFFDNNFVTNGLSSGNTTPAPNSVFSFVAPYSPTAVATYTDAKYVASPLATSPLYSSYFNNFITPIQRRGTFSEYLMETCPKLPVSECDSGADWSVDGAGLKASDEVGNAFAAATHKAGTTAQPPQTTAALDLQKYARRLAFLRQTTGANAGNLILDAQNKPIPLGIDSTGQIQCYTSGGTGPFDLGSGTTVSCVAFSGTNKPRTPPTPFDTNALLYRTVNNADPYTNPGTTDFSSNNRLFFAEDLVLGTGKRAGSAGNEKAQPLLVPILQIHSPNNLNKVNPFLNVPQTVYGTHWLPQAPANNVTFNLILAAGDSPGRTNEFNGALSNFPRFMENWATPTASKAALTYQPVTIQGSFLQLKRSAYATAPYWQILDTAAGVNGIFTGTATTPSNVFFRYPQSYRNATAKYQNYEPPERRWGFDVGLLSQLPDAFAKKLNRNSSEEPNEYYREANRDDDWVQTLLCAVQYNTNNVNDISKAAINKDQRPSGSTGFCATKSRQAS